MGRSHDLVDLIKLRKPLGVAIAKVRQLPWDSDEELAMVQPDDVARVLAGFLGGFLSAEAVEDWANAIECRDDIGFMPMAMKGVVEELANPLLHRGLDRDVALSLLETVENSEESQ